MINEKMYRLGSARSEIRELFEYGKRRKAEIGEENVHDFSLGNPSVPCPEGVTEALRSLIANEDPVSLHGYTSAQGDAAARAAIAKRITEEHGFEVSADDLYLTVGAAAALTATLAAVTTEGEEVILLAPYFPEYKVFAERAGATVRVVKCDPESFAPSSDAIRDAINERTAAIIVNSPNNPTGAVYPEECVRAIAEVLAEKSREYGRSIYLIADEPYRELVYDGATVPFIPSYYADTVVCYSYSKSLSLPGERIGYVLVSPRANESRRLYAAVCGAGRSLGYVCAPSLLQKAIPYCIGLTSDISVYARNRQLLLTKLCEYGFEVVRPDGAFYLFMRSPIGDARAFSEMAKKHELLLVASDSFGYPGYVRISYCVDTERIERALGAFEALARELGLIGE
jgi:aspartate aminotransferase